LRVVTSRERRITALMCGIVALTCVFDVGQEFYAGQPVDYVKVFIGAALIGLACYSLIRAHTGA
jgi:hypothetical protein